MPSSAASVFFFCSTQLIFSVTTSIDLRRVTPPSAVAIWYARLFSTWFASSNPRSYVFTSTASSSAVNNSELPVNAVRSAASVFFFCSTQLIFSVTTSIDLRRVTPPSAVAIWYAWLFSTWFASSNPRSYVFTSTASSSAVNNSELPVNAVRSAASVFFFCSTQLIFSVTTSIDLRRVTPPSAVAIWYAWLFSTWFASSNPRSYVFTSTASSSAVNNSELPVNAVRSAASVFFFCSTQLIFSVTTSIDLRRVTPPSAVAIWYAWLFSTWFASSNPRSYGLASTRSSSAVNYSELPVHADRSAASVFFFCSTQLIFSVTTSIDLRRVTPPSAVAIWYAWLFSTWFASSNPRSYVFTSTASSSAVNNSELPVNAVRSAASVFFFCSTQLIFSVTTSIDLRRVTPPSAVAIWYAWLFSTWFASSNPRSYVFTSTASSSAVNNSELPVNAVRSAASVFFFCSTQLIFSVTTSIDLRRVTPPSAVAIWYAWLFSTWFASSNPRSYVFTSTASSSAVNNSELPVNAVRSAASVFFFCSPQLIFSVTTSIDLRRVTPPSAVAIWYAWLFSTWFASSNPRSYVFTSTASSSAVNNSELPVNAVRSAASVFFFCSTQLIFSVTTSIDLRRVTPPSAVAIWYARLFSTWFASSNPRSYVLTSTASSSAVNNSELPVNAVRSAASVFFFCSTQLIFSVTTSIDLRRVTPPSAVAIWYAWLFS